MYLQNKYTNWYNNIIFQAQSRNLKNRQQAKLVLGYCERHHIIPKSLSGSDKSENLVYLTAHEHFICHLLLTKMTIGPANRSMWHALWKVTNQKRLYQHRYKVTGRMYEKIKIQNAKSLSESNKGKPNYKSKGKPKTDEHKKNLSIALTGYKHTDERNAAISRAHLGKKQPPRSVEWANNLRESCLANRKICEYCGKDVPFKGYQRWHGMRCKDV